MNKAQIRFFITDARLSYPALDAPRPSIQDQNDKRYQATFLLEPTNPCVPKLKEAIKQVAVQAFGPERAGAVLRDIKRIPLRPGESKEVVPEGYEGMLYLGAKSRTKPELRDANPSIKITDPEIIRERFAPGYRVNGYIDLFAFEKKSEGGAVLNYGIAASLVSVQFKAYADTFSARAATKDEDYPDCSADAAASGEYTPAVDPYAPAQTAAAPVQTAGTSFADADLSGVDDIPF